MLKNILKDYEGALEDFDKVNVLEPNHAFNLRIRGDVKRILEDYQGALEDLDKADVLEPNHAFTLQICGDVKELHQIFVFFSSRNLVGKIFKCR